MKKREKPLYIEDDGRTIADMSGLERTPLLLPHLPRRRRGEDAAEETHEDEFTPRERRAAIRGAMRAALLIALVFVGAGALLILALQLLWNP